MSTESVVATGPSTDASSPEASAVRVWGKRIEKALPGLKKRVEEFRRNRAYVAGRELDGVGPKKTLANLIHATVATILPHVYSRDPEVAISPTEAVSDDQYEAYKAFCATSEVVLRRMAIRDTDLKKRLKAAIRSAMTTGEGWLKVWFQRDFEEDPTARQRMNDVQDNINRLRSLAADVERPECGDEEKQAKLYELELQLSAIEGELEVEVAYGLNIERVLTEDILILDESCREFDDYAKSRAIAQRTWFTKEEYSERFGGWPSDASEAPTLYQAPKQDYGAIDVKLDVHASEGWVAVWEIWDRTSSTVYTLAEGMKEWCREPFQPPHLGERWYPFFGMTFIQVEGIREGQSDVAQLIDLQEEYTESRTQLAEHRAESLPVRIGRRGGSLTEEDLKNIQARKAGQIVMVGGKPGRPLEEDLFAFPNIPLDPMVYDTSAIRADIEMVSGRGDAAAGAVHQAKTATEAQIMQSGLMSRTEERRDVVEDYLTELFRYSLELLLQELTEEEVIRIAGQPAPTPEQMAAEQMAAAQGLPPPPRPPVWPQMAKETIFDHINLEVRAGSTGKPDQAQEREQWTALLPQLQELVLKLAELYASASFDVAKSLRELMRETLRRFDERLDLDAILPPEPTPEEQEAIRMQLQQQAMMQATAGGPPQ